MTLKERIIKILEQKNINHYSVENEIHVFPPVTNELMQFLKLIKDDSFDLVGGLSPHEEKSEMHLYIRFNTNK